MKKTFIETRFTEFSRVNTRLLIPILTLLLGFPVFSRGQVPAQQTVVPPKSQQREQEKSNCPPQLPGGAGVKCFPSQFVWVYTGNADLAAKVLPAIENAAKIFSRHFGVAPPLVAVFDGAAVDAEQRNALTAAGAVWVLPLPVSLMAGRQGAEDRAISALTHEIGHGWFVNSLWAGGAGTPGLNYGGDAPDWLDEAAAILLENEAMTIDRRSTLKKLWANSETAKLIKPLNELFVMKHPGLSTSQIQELMKQMQEARARGEVTTSVSQRPDAQSQQGVIAFYAQCRVFVDYLFHKGNDPKVLRSITDTLKSGKTMDTWLAAEGKRFGLPQNLKLLQADWDQWLKTR